jgi:hypothetical protein
MLEIKLSNIKKINEEGTHIILTDATGNYGEYTYVKSTTVDEQYDMITNSTGYGEPNLARTDLAIYPVGLYNGSKGDTEVEFEPYSLFSATEYHGKAPVDGVYTFYLIFVGLAVDETAPYYQAGKLLRKINGTIVEIQPKDLINTEWCTPSIRQLFVANNSKRKIELNIEKNLLVKSNVAGRNDKEIRRVQKLYNELRGILSGAIYEYCRGNVTNAQVDIEFLNINTENC